MTPHADEPRSDRWLIYTLGCCVFAGILYFCLRRFFDVSVTASLATALPAGVIGFFIVAKILEHTDTPPGFWDGGS